MVPDIKYGKVTSYKKGFALIPPNFVYNDVADCDKWKDFDPLFEDSYANLSSTVNFITTNILS